MKGRTKGRMYLPKIKKAACLSAAALVGAAVPVTALIPSVATVFAADPETHTKASTGKKDGFLYTYSTIDTTKKGSIQIFKYEENNGLMTEGTGFVDENANKSKNSETRRPIQGVQFKGIKIADVETVAGDDTVGTYYTNLNSIFTNLLTRYGLSNVPKTKDFGTGSDASKNGKYYTTASIEEAMKLLTQATAPANDSVGANNEYPGHKGTERTLAGIDAVNDAVNEANGGVNFGYTDADGYAKVSNLPLGLYLIAETDYKPNAILNKEYKSADNDPDGAKYSATGENVTGDDSQNHQDVDVSTTPFIVSVPMTNVSSFTADDQTPVEKGTVWFYDITTYPKNQTTNITKKIIDPDTKDGKKLEDYEDYSIGDTIKQVIYADAPANMKLETVETENNASGKSDRAKQEPNRYTIYAIHDTMEKGLEFDGVTKVVYGNKVSPTKESDFDSLGTLTLNTDYKVIKAPVSVNPMTSETYAQNQARLTQALNSAEKATKYEWCVQLTPAGLAKLNAAEGASTVAVFFDTQVTPDAKIGTENKNTNQADLTIKHEWTSTYKKYSNETRVFTYEMDITKMTAENLPDKFHPEKTSFTVKQTKHDGDGYASRERTRDNQKNINLNNDVKVDNLDTDWDDTDFVKFIEEKAGVYHVYADLEDKEAEATTIIRPASDGKLIIKGLDSAVYTITERSTQDHYSLLAAPVKIDLIAATQTDTADYRSDAALTRQAKNGLADTHVNGALNKPTATADKTSTVLSTKDGNDGIVVFKIENGTIPELRTGGQGTKAIYMSAAVVGTGAAAAYIAKKKKSKKAE